MKPLTKYQLYICAKTVDQMLKDDDKEHLEMLEDKKFYCNNRKSTRRRNKSKYVTKELYND